MNWAIFAIFAYVAVVVDRSLTVLFPDGAAAPSMTLVLMVYLAMSAPPWKVMWSALLLGLLVDLSQKLTLVDGPQAAVLVGPHALGYLVGAYLVLQVRAMLFRHSLLSLLALVVAGGMLAQLVIVFLLSVRGLSIVPGEAVTQWSAMGEVGTRFVQVIYSAVLALPLGWLLIRLEPLWQFSAGKGGSHVSSQRRAPRHR